MKQTKSYNKIGVLVFIFVTYFMSIKELRTHDIKFALTCQSICTKPWSYNHISIHKEGGPRAIYTIAIALYEIIRLWVDHF